MIRKTLLFLLVASTICLAACKVEPDLPDDPHVPLVNPFIGVWKTGAEYWRFNPNGTGGKASTQSGPFPDSFSFLYFNGKGNHGHAAPSLVILEDSNGEVSVTRYTYSSATVQWATLTPATGESPVMLERVSGSPQVISLTNSLIGEWLADWTGSHNTGSSTWSLKYYTDGTVKMYHHGMGDHQFENAYALRGNTLVIFGTLRFMIAPIIGEINQQGNGKWHVQERQTNPVPVEWTYTKVATAEWL